MAIHDYNLDPTYVATNIDAVKGVSLNSGKRLLYEEFGGLGGTKQNQIQVVTDTLISVCLIDSTLLISLKFYHILSDRSAMDVLGG